jgi:hypothetical protein
VLTTDVDLAAVEVYDYVPESATLPYITIGEAIETPFDAHNHIGYRLSFVLNIWTRDVAGGPRGFREGLLISHHIDEALNHVDIAVSGGRTAHVSVETTETLRDPDPQLRRVRKVCRTFLQRV